MAFINDYIFDAALAILDAEADRLDICSQEPTSYAEATATYSLGNKAAVAIGAPEDRTPSGRKVVVPAITDGNATASGTATHWAVVDTVNSRLLASGSLTNPQVITSGNTFTLDAIDIGMADAVDA